MTSTCPACGIVTPLLIVAFSVLPPWITTTCAPSAASPARPANAVPFDVVAVELGVDRDCTAGAHRRVRVDIGLDAALDTGDIDRAADPDGPARQAAGEAGVADLALGPDVHVAPRIDADARADEGDGALRHDRAVDRIIGRARGDRAVDPALGGVDVVGDELRVARRPVVLRAGQRSDQRRGTARLAVGVRGRARRSPSLTLSAVPSLELPSL